MTLFLDQILLKCSLLIQYSTHSCRYLFTFLVFSNSSLCFLLLFSFIFQRLHIRTSKDNQDKFSGMQNVLNRGPKAIFFERLFFNIPLKLVRYSKFRSSTKCWIKLLDLCSSLTKFFIGNKELYPEIATQLLSVRLCFRCSLIKIGYIEILGRMPSNTEFHR